jgi:putative FmdB family regulatory protein
MPIYEYLCKKCGQASELLVMSKAVPACPHCHSRRLQKLVSAPTAPGQSKAVLAASRARAAQEGHTSNYRHVNGKVVN